VDAYANGKSDAWVYDEVLVQLHDVRAELRKLNEQVSQIKDELRKTAAKYDGAGKVKVVALDDAYVAGADNASVAIIEFSDYQCPFCKKHHNYTFSVLKRSYLDSGKIKYAVMDFPLSFHGQAESAAVVARCAGKQGKFWEMQHALFETKQPLGGVLYRNLASKLNLDAKEFDVCLEDKKIVTLINKQMDYGTQLGVQGTPAFFIGKVKGDKVMNARFVSGAQGYEKFSEIIESLLTQQ
jgi:protein-disulfide isomerase